MALKIPKVNDLLPHEKGMCVVESVTDSTAHVRTIDFDYEQWPSTWTLNGKSCRYNPAEEYDVEDPDARPAWRSFDVSLPLAANVVLNPTAQQARQAGCGMRGMYAHLFMSCGVVVACPLCYGHGYAEEDKRMIQHYYHRGGTYPMKWRKERLTQLEGMAREFGLPVLPSWNELYGEQQQQEEGEDGEDECETRVRGLAVD